MSRLSFTHLYDPPEEDLEAICAEVQEYPKCTNHCELFHSGVCEFQTPEEAATEALLFAKQLEEEAELAATMDEAVEAYYEFMEEVANDPTDWAAL